MNKITVEVWSDIACPYCYIGKRKFEKALEQFPQANNVELIWHSYELNPQLQKGVDSLEHKKTYYTPSSSLKLRSLAADVGLEYNLDQLFFTNTSDALRLIKLAKEAGRADQAEEILFRAYFTEGKDISNREVLIDAGHTLGLSRLAVEEILDSERFLKDIEDDIRYSEEQLNLQYIPFYRINNKITIEGSLQIEEYLNALEAAIAPQAEDTSFSGQSCSTDGICS